MKTLTRKPAPADVARWMGTAKALGAQALLIYFDTSDRAFFPVYVSAGSSMAHTMNRCKGVNPLAEHVETLEVAY